MFLDHKSRAKLKKAKNVMEINSSQILLPEFILGGYKHSILRIIMR